MVTAPPAGAPSPPIRDGGRMTLDEFFALPDSVRDEFDLLRGVVHRRNPPPDDNGVVVRDVFQCSCQARLDATLAKWSDVRPGEHAVLSSETGVRFDRSASAVGMDAAVFAAGGASRDASDRRYVVGVPRLAVEILSFTDTFGGLLEKRRAYEAAGVPLVWVVDPDERAVTVYRPGERPRRMAEDDPVEGGDALPGFAVAARDLFPPPPFDE